MSKPTATGWLIRDLSITAILGLLLTLAYLWHSHYPSIVSTLVVPGISFIAAYMICYIVHEWGHLGGALAAGGTMPISPYKGILIGAFDVKQNTRKQFLWLSWGGVAGYTLVTICCLGLYVWGELSLVGAGLAVGGLAFVSQSWSVDLPIIFKVHRGADIFESATKGAHPKVILKRTWQAWIPLGIAVTGYATLQ